MNNNSLNPNTVLWARYCYHLCSEMRKRGSRRLNAFPGVTQLSVEVGSEPRQVSSLGVTHGPAPDAYGRWSSLVVNHFIRGPVVGAATPVRVPAVFTRGVPGLLPSNWETGLPGACPWGWGAHPLPCLCPHLLGDEQTPAGVQSP